MWQKNKPDGGDSIQSSDDYLRDNFAWLESTLGHAHTFPGAAATRGKHTPGSQPVCDIETQAVLSAYTDVEGAISYPTDLESLYTNDGSNWYARSIPPSAVMLFFQATAPSGWTLITSVNDSMMYVTSGSLASGAALSIGTWSISGLTWSHFHLYSTVPRHTHYFARTNQATGVPLYAFGYGYYTDPNTWSIAGSTPPCTSSAFNDALSGDGGWRPYYAHCILASKDD